MKTFRFKELEEKYQKELIENGVGNLKQNDITETEEQARKSFEEDNEEYYIAEDDTAREVGC